MQQCYPYLQLGHLILERRLGLVSELVGVLALFVGTPKTVGLRRRI